MESFWFSSRIWSSSSDYCVSSFPNFTFLIYFTCMFALARTSGKKLNSTNKSRYSFSCSWLNWNVSGVSQLSRSWFCFEINTFYYVSEVSSCAGHLPSVSQLHLTLLLTPFVVRTPPTKEYENSCPTLIWCWG